MSEKTTLKVVDDEQLALFAFDESGQQKEEVISEETYRLVGDEVLQEKLDPECWAKALASGGRTKDEALSNYAQIRSEELADTLTKKDAKAQALEARRLAAGLSESSAPTRIVWRKRFSLMWDFLFWQILLSVSGVGLFLVLLAMGTDSRWWPGLLPLVVVSACLQLFPVVFLSLGKLLVGKVTYTQALGATAILLISAGSFLGVQAMTGKRTPSWVQTALSKVVGPQLAQEGVFAISEEEF